MDASQDHIADFAQFIAASPSSYHAAAEVARRLDAAGFTGLNEAQPWTGGAGRYYVVRDGAVIAWLQPDQAHATTPFRILGAHTDSPGFKLKPKPTIGSNGWLQAGVEVYGGPLLNSWLDRELELAGRLVTHDGAEHLVRTGPFLRIPQLAIHLDRDVNNGLTLDKQRHLNPVFGVGDADQADLVGHLAGLAGLSGSDVAGYDLLTADTAAPARFGLNGDLFAAGRMDNLSAVHAGLVALLAAAGSPGGTSSPGSPGGTRAPGSPGSSGGASAPGSPGSSGGASAPGSNSSGSNTADHISVLAAFDHEELGSESRSGASGPFLADILARIGDGLGAGVSERARALAASWCLSADAGHAVHPNYVERHDPANLPVAGGGPLLKINANQRYATDAHGAALFARCCAAAGVAYQEFVSNNTVPCGSTIGPLTATRLGIRTVDVGVPLLSMHSARELCHVADPTALAAAAGAFFAGA